LRSVEDSVINENKRTVIPSGKDTNPQSLVYILVNDLNPLATNPHAPSFYVSGDLSTFNYYLVLSNKTDR
jgi:hypothetical protein